MNLAELQAEVILETKRPDLVADTLSAVLQATLKLHNLDFWKKDLLETGISFAAARYEQDFEVKTFLPRYRSIAYARAYDNINGTPLKFFTKVDPNNVVDSYNIARVNIMYQGGAEIHFKYESEFQHMLFGYWANPVLTDPGYTSWIAEEYPYAIVHEAARRIFAKTGNDKKVQTSAQEVAEQVALLRINCISELGE